MSRSALEQLWKECGFKLYDFVSFEHGKQLCATISRYAFNRYCGEMKLAPVNSWDRPEIK